LDGAATWQEYHAGTNPNASGSLLRLGVAEIAPLWKVSWFGVTNRNYRLAMSSNLSLGTWTPVAPGNPIPGVGQMIEVDVPRIEPRAYFRLEVSPNP
jgi:hypothetical protein